MLCDTNYRKAHTSSYIPPPATCEIDNGFVCSYKFCNKYTVKYNIYIGKRYADFVGQSVPIHI